MKNIKFGLVIQGPVTTFGDGPNNSKEGFLTDDCINGNIESFSSLVEKIVISTWEGCGLSPTQSSSKVVIIENEAIHGFDFLNQRKQFFTTQSGVEWLRKNTDCTHVLKIRTDQLVPPELIPWLQNFYENSNFQARNQEDFLMFSEALKGESFYAGDFMFAGTIKDISNFCRAVLCAEGRVHPMNSCDYVLKWLQLIDNKFLSDSSMLTRSFLTARNTLRIQYLWNEVLKDRICLPPKEIYKKIQWRGKPMPDVLESIDTAFFFNEDISSYDISPIRTRSIWKTYKLMRDYWKRYLMAKRDFEHKEGGA